MRRTIITTVYLAVFLVLATSCNKQEDYPIASERTVITAVADQIGTGTKVEMAYCYNALWQTGDQIHVKQGQTTDTFTLVDGQGTTKGTFEGTKSISGKIEAFYPVSVGESMEWPSVQTNTQAVPMYANQTISGTGSEIVSFSSLGAMLQIVLSTSEKDVVLSKIRISDVEKPMSGPFTVDGGKAVISSSDKSDITLNLDNVGIGGAAKYFNIAVPAGKYDNLKLDFINNDDGVITLSSTTMPEILQNSVAKISLCLSGAFKHPVSGVTLDKTSMTKNIGNHYAFTATISPEKADNKNVIWTSSDETVASVSPDGRVDFLKEGDAVITVTTEDGGYSASCDVHVYTPTLPKDALPGLFTVANGIQVYFSKGNLWKTAKKDAEGVTWSWLFEKNQYDFHTFSETYGEHGYYQHDYGLFGWADAKTDVPYITTSTAPTSYRWPAGKDPWGATIDDKGTWRTLTNAEWDHIGRARGKWTNVNGIKGLVLAPDGFDVKLLKESYTLSEWAEAEESSKLVFLPAAGRRLDKGVSMLDYGYYWSSTEVQPEKTFTQRKYACFLKFFDEGKGAAPDYKYYGCSVRLVSEVKPDINE